jgi:pilus assembly protein Flp/PilA
MSRARIQDESGGSAVEYSLVASAVAALVVAILFALGRISASTYLDTCNTVASKAAPATDCTK